MDKSLILIIGLVGSAITIFTFISGIPHLSGLWNRIEMSVNNKDYSKVSLLPKPEQKREPDQENTHQQKPIQEREAVSPATKSAEPAVPRKKAWEEAQYPKETQNNAGNLSPPIAPSVNWQDTFAQALSEIEGRSQWQCDPALSSLLKESPVEVVFTEPRSREAAEIVHRLRRVGANVTFRLVSAGDSTVKQDGLFYHWNRLKMAQAIQAVVHDVEVLELIRNDQSGRMALWIM